MKAKGISSAATVILAVAVLLLYRAHVLFAANPYGVGVQVAAAALMIWARLTFGLRSFHFSANTTAGGLVTTGPYRWMRHPIYAAVVAFVWAGVLSAPSTTGVVLGLIATAMSAIRIRAEESFLRSEYAEYAAYERRTKRLIPFVF